MQDNTNHLFALLTHADAPYFAFKHTKWINYRVRL